MTQTPKDIRAAIIRASLPAMSEAHVLELAALYLYWEARPPHCATSEYIAHVECALERDEYYPNDPS